MRPGKPLMVGRRGATRFLGMPGNPVASLVCSHLFLKPLIAKLSGTVARHDIRPAVLGAAMKANDLRQDYVRAKLTVDNGAAVATPFSVQDSSMLRVPGRVRRADNPTALRACCRSRRCLRNSHAVTIWQSAQANFAANRPGRCISRRYADLFAFNDFYPVLTVAEHNWNR